MAREYIDFLEVALYLTNPPHHHYPPHPHYIIPLNIPLIFIILSKCGGQRELAQRQHMRWTVKTRLMRWTVKTRYMWWTARTSTKSANAVDCDNSVYAVDSEN